MTIVRLNPISLTMGDIDTFHRQMNRLFDGLTDGLANDLGFSTALQERGLDTFTPNAELIETDEALVLNLELPGMNPDDLEVEVTAESVSVKGERIANAESNENLIGRSEFRYGPFHRIIPLPTPIQQTNVEADYKNGILSLTLPKVVEEKDKVVKVTVR